MEVVKKEVKAPAKKNVGSATKKEKTTKKETTAVKGNKEETTPAVKEDKKDYIVPTINVNAETEIETKPVVEAVVSEIEPETEVMETILEEVKADNISAEVTVETELKNIEEKNNENAQPKRNNSAFNHYWNGQSSGW